jgi:predicted acyltransferase
MGPQVDSDEIRARGQVSGPTGRLQSIDALRGFDMFWIMGGDALFRAIANAAGAPWSPLVLRQLEHAEWEGFYFYDLIFPLFLFLVGAVLPFSLARQRSVPAALGRIGRRTLLLVLFGLIYNGLLRFEWEDLRLAGVLQRIGICYGTGALIVMMTRSSVVIRTVLALAILVGYTAIFQSFAPPGGSLGDYAKETNLAGWVDRTYLPGKIYPAYYGFGDNEGLLSTIPAVATVLLGAVAGEILRKTGSPRSKLVALGLYGAIALVAGYGAQGYCPIVKNLWTATFVLVSAGWSFLLLALFYAIIDVKGWRAWSFPFVVIGANAITIYLAPVLVDFEFSAAAIFGGLARTVGLWGPAVIAAGVILCKWVFLYMLYRNRWFLRV